TLTEAVKNAARRPAHPFRVSTLTKLDELVSEVRHDLSSALQVLQLKDNQNAQNDIEEVKQSIKIAQAQQLAANVRSWLSAPDAMLDYNAASTKRRPGTVRWLVQSTSFETWLEQENSFLWLHGFAGCE
ncbi:hypothetical protein MMC29_007822, partial [Sticta canariensis]|nr:hypothetical protein [Sticta canariensis]